MGATPTQMMNPAMSSQMIMAQLQKMEPMILAGAFLAHIIYGAILDAITIVRITKIDTNPSNNGLMDMIPCCS
jgi:hypothetical protein